MKRIEKFLALDGTVFNTEKECLNHECNLYNCVIALNGDLERISVDLIRDEGYFIKVLDNTGVAMLQNLGYKEITKIGIYVWFDFDEEFTCLEDIPKIFENLE